MTVGRVSSAFVAFGTHQTLAYKREFIKPTEFILAIYYALASLRVSHIHSVMYSLNHSLNHSLTQSLTHSLT